MIITVFQQLDEKLLQYIHMYISVYTYIYIYKILQETSTWSEHSKYWPSKYSTNYTLLLSIFLINYFRFKTMLHFSQPLFHSPSTMFSVPVMIAVCCSSTEALVAGNQELLFLCKKKENLLQKAGKYKNTERGPVGTTEQGRYCNGTACCTMKMWRVRSEQCSVITGWRIEQAQGVTAS